MNYMFPPQSRGGTATDSDGGDIQRLVRQVSTALRAMPIEVDGEDDQIRELATYHGLRSTDAVILKLRTNTRRFTLVVATSRTWERSRHALIAIKHDAARSQRKVQLVPAGRLRRTNFLTNCALIGTSRKVRITATDRMAIIARLREDPCSSLDDCAREIDGHEDPVGAVLAMVAEGFLRMDLRAPMRPESQVSVA